MKGFNCRYLHLLFLMLCACTPLQDKQQAGQFCIAHGYDANSPEFNNCMDAYFTAQAHIKRITEDCDREANSAYLGSFRLNPALTDNEAKTIGDAARSKCMDAAKTLDKQQLFKQQQLYLIEREMRP